MTLFHSLILGLVEGITEYLPVSSTAHIIIASNLLHIPQTDFQKFFEVFIQSGAILAVIILYFNYLLKNRDLVIKIMYSFLPTAVIGFLLYKIIKNVFFTSNNLIIGALFVVGVLFLIVEFLIKKKTIKLHKTIEELSFKEAVLIGLAQSLAVIPGVSRAGSVIVAMLILSYKREDAAKYSFILAVPTIVAASAYDLYKMREVVLHSGNNFLFLLVGFVVSFITAYISIKWLIEFLQKNSLVVFGIYRIVLAIILCAPVA